MLLPYDDNDEPGKIPNKDLGLILTAKIMTVMIIMSIMMIIYINEHLPIKVSPYWSQG